IDRSGGSRHCAASSKRFPAVDKRCGRVAGKAKAYDHYLRRSTLWEQRDSIRPGVSERGRNLFSDAVGLFGSQLSLSSRESETHRTESRKQDLRRDNI